MFPSRSGPTFSAACASQSWYQHHSLFFVMASVVLQEVCACEVLYRSLKQDATDAPTMIANPFCDETAFN